MKTTLVALLSLVGMTMGAVVEKRDCHANNCARQVTGSHPDLLPMESRRADCSSFQLTTVTPDPETVTKTVTLYDDIADLRVRHVTLQARAETVFATATPTYASFCSEEGEYPSVCSCWGITASVTTVDTPTVTVTSTEIIDYC